MRDETMRRTILRGTAAVLLVALAACQNSQQARAPEPEEDESFLDAFQIGNVANMLRTAPDEFSVLTKRPLEMPRDFAALPPPEPGKPSTRDIDPQAEARAALAFDPVPASAAASTPSATETAILSSAGPADPNIRATLATEEAASGEEFNDYLLYRIFPGMRAAQGDLYPNAIDAEAERVRLLESGVTPRRTGLPAGVPAASLPPAVPATPVAVAPAAPLPPDVGAGPVLAAPEPRTVPTLGVLAPEAGDPAPPLIYLPE